MNLIRHLLYKIRASSTFLKLPNGTFCETISITKILIIAKSLKVPLKTVEITAIKNNIMPERYIRNMNTISFADQLKLLNTRVCIVGLGGLGGIVLENLIRIGIGHFRLIDGDVFEVHNLNRQILSSIHKIGEFKANSALERINIINPSVSAVALTEYLTEENSASLIQDCDLTVDCLDNIKTRFILEAESKRKKIPMISAAIAGTAGYITTIFPQDKGLELVFGKKIDLIKNHGVETTVGCISYAVNIIASIECSEIIKIILGKKTLKNKLLIVDVEDYTFETINLN